MPSVIDNKGPAYWRSLEHLTDTPEFRTFMHREFPAGASELLGEDRRQFIKIMGASMAFAGLGLAGCRRWPEQDIAPYANRPEGQDPGIPLSYATIMEISGVATGLLATAYDGRPTKLEGNPDHVANGGGTDAFTQASILDLYDPDRSRTVLKGGEASDPAAFATWIKERMAGQRTERGSRIAVLTQRVSSPTIGALRAQMDADFGDVMWCTYEPFGSDNDMAGAARLFGAPWRAHRRYEDAKAILAFESDFLSTVGTGVASSRGFAAGRRVSAGAPEMSRLYAVESEVTVTGASADERLAVASSHIPAAVAYVASRILNLADLRSVENDPKAADVLSAEIRKVLDHAVEDLRANRGASIVVAGEGQTPEVHTLVHAMNEALGNHGRTIVFTAPTEMPGDSIAALASAIDEGRIETLIILGGNPAFDAPAGLDFAAKMAKVEGTVHLSAYVDETSSKCMWHLPQAHFLEAWSDGRTADGTYAVGQPLIEPLYDHARSGIEVVGMMAGATGDARTLVRSTFAEMTGRDNDGVWRRVLRDGMLAGSASTVEAPKVIDGAAAEAGRAMVAAWMTGGTDGWELVFAPSPAVFDGRYANNGWLQELPDPITKLTWDNAVIIGVDSASSLGVKTGDRVTVANGGTTVEAVAYVLPGVPARSAVLHCGFGREFEGRICAGAGFNFYPLRTEANQGYARGATVTKASGTYPLATTQDHHTIDPDSVGGKGIADRLPSLFRETDLAHYAKDPKFAAHKAHVPHRLSLWEQPSLDGQYAWGMSIDLNTCTGCSACVVACQAENNIPIVGKDQVLRGREMHWLRVDRYFTFAHDESGHPDANRPTSTRLMPVMCLHCENAPCEQVCPVAATVHDEDGLNVMVYNRCIGTRYCSNNCPYKVRRFNYFDYHRRDPERAESDLLQVNPDYYLRKQATREDETLNLQFNPEVTVRMRGVMEKCTFCTQRIAEARIEAKNAYVQLPEAEKEALMNSRVPVADGRITPACAQACSTEALVFGDLNDPESRVSKLQHDNRSYQMLEELHVKTRTKYLAKVTNPAFPPEHHDAGHGGQTNDH